MYKANALISTMDARLQVHDRSNVGSVPTNLWPILASESYGDIRNSVSHSNIKSTILARIAVPSIIASNPIPGKNAPFETLERARPMLV